MILSYFGDKIDEYFHQRRILKYYKLEQKFDNDFNKFEKYKK